MGYIEEIKNKYLKDNTENRMKIILLSGKAESGKSTSAKMLKELLEASGKKVAVVSYGNYVKETARNLFGWDGSKDENGRALLQWWGTDYVRERDPEFWTKTVFRLAKVASGCFDYLIIDDARFKNEITFWSNCCFDILTVRVERPNHTNILTEKQRNHPSETDLDNYCFDKYVIVNNMKELEQSINWLCEDINEHFS